MSPENTSQPTKICPTCGTRLNENAARCPVCGRNFTVSKAENESVNVRGARIPEITLSLPIALGLLILVLAIGAGTVFIVLRSTGRVVEPTVTPTTTPTLTATLTATPTLTWTPVPTFTLLPPVEYVVKRGDICSSIAGFFKVSVQSIVMLNNLSPECPLSVGQKLNIPQPTPTASPLPTATLSDLQATEAACEKLSYTVKKNDTLSVIAATYNVTIESIKAYNGLGSDNVYEGQTLRIPLCARRPTAGPTPTATLPPPYPAPNLLLPADGAAFVTASDTITLQWASVGTLRQNEAYAITLEDITEGTGRKLLDYVTDTKYIVPASFRPSGRVPHVIRWSILSVRQVGTTKEGQPQWQPAGAPSSPRVFSWWGAGTAGTPAP